MKKFIIFILFLLSAGLCYLATRPSHAPSVLPSINTGAAKNVTAKLPSLPTMPQSTGRHSMLESLPHPLKDFFPRLLFKRCNSRQSGQGQLGRLKGHATGNASGSHCH